MNMMCIVSLNTRASSTAVCLPFLSSGDSAERKRKLAVVFGGAEEPCAASDCLRSRLLHSKVKRRCDFLYEVIRRSLFCLVYVRCVLVFGCKAARSLQKSVLRERERERGRER